MDASQSQTGGVRFPAEWEAHRAIWTAWPSTEAWWGSAYTRAQEQVAAFCLAMAEGGDARLQDTARPQEKIKVLVNGSVELARAQTALSHPRIELVEAPFGDTWLRDTGALFTVTEHGKLTAATFRFNGWGGKYVYPDDDTVAARMAAWEGVPARAYDWVLEGGSLELDGQGNALTTRQCLLNPNRQGAEPATEAIWAERLREALGVRQLIWLEEGLLNDHTDGHIDNLARFAPGNRILCPLPRRADDPNAAALQANYKVLQAARSWQGQAYELVALPSITGVCDEDGQPIPASYMNFLITNWRVLVPLYGADTDEEALRILAEVFEDRTVVGLPADAILSGGGAFHCITQQVPLV